MLSKTLKKSAGRVLEPLGRGIGKLGIRPNHITIAGLILTLYAAWFLYNQDIYYAFLIGLIASLFDGADGLVARSTGTSSIRGGYLDAVIDRYADCVAFSALILGGWMKPIEGLEFIAGEVWAIVAMVGAFQTSYSRAAAERLGVSQESVGIIERPERWFILGMGLLVGEMLGDVEVIITWVVAFLAIFGNATVLQRMYHFWTEVKDD
ncbi:MAG: CDP-alcohol phosphatidyltransferase family protein [Candidatus Thermoplasmatota archaeon]|nr:CDP-alcohol phosphatidyltransferase family protein [Candidatus Thermoplasmatota archaeon]MEC8997495.1 CDP-alcohol phosphatidyltransferase family protein [Candidatus Thermoplasmatota archaeon]